MPIRKVPAFVTALLLVTATPLAAAGAPAGKAFSCSPTTVTAPLAAAPGSTTRVATWLCAQGAPKGKPLVVAVPGTTYTHRYWDWDQEPGRYSFARRFAAAGYAVLLYDRTGTGASDHPPVAQVTLDTHALVLHHLVADARRMGFETVVTAGHSQGSFVAMAEAARFGDVDALIVTGALHTPLHPAGAALVAATFGYPAQADARFADVPLGYATSVPGLRGPAFYSDAADPAVIAHDEATKTVTAPPELATAPSALAETPAVRVPVLSVIGQRDAAFCPPAIGCGHPSLPDPIDQEAQFWAPEARVATVVLAGAGHDINLHPNARDWYADALAWLRLIGS